MGSALLSDPEKIEAVSFLRFFFFLLYQFY